MKYAKRMVLVPESEYLAMPKQRKKLNEREAARATSQKLAKQIRRREHIAVKNRTHAEPVDPGVHLSSVYPAEEPEMDLMEIAEHMPVNYQNKTKLLLTYLNKKGIVWNDRKEVVLPGGSVLQNSNIVDLLKEALARSTAVTKPRGWEEFLAGMVAAGVPMSFFTKKSTLQALQREQPTWISY